jgi:hypothetical protein
VTIRAHVRPFAALANLAVLAAVYLCLFFRTGRLSPSYAGVLVAGPLVVVLAVFLTFARGPARLAVRAGLAGARIRGVLGTAPWLALFAVVAFRGLWWTQRPYPLRLFGVWTLANWSIWWCTARFGRSGAEGAADRHQGSAQNPAFGVGSAPETVLLAVVGILGAAGLEGLAFGLTPFGVAVSALAALAAALGLAAGGLGGRSARLNALAALVATLVALGGVEGGLRALHMGHALQEADSLEYARQFNNLTPPRSAFVNRPKMLDEFAPALIETNTLGLRGPEIAADPVDLLLLGDSFIESRQLPWEQTLVPRLREALRARAAAARVAGHGMRGWSPLLEWNWYLKVGRRLRPRTVLLFFFWNDLWSRGDEVRTFRAVMGPDGRPDHFEALVESDWLWYKHLRAVRLAGDVLQRFGLQAIRQAFAGAGARLVGGVALDTPRAVELARRTAGGRMLSTGEIEALLTRQVDDFQGDLREVAWSGFWPGLRPLALWTDEQRRAAATTARELRRFAEDVAADGGRLAIVYVPNPYQIAAAECSVGRYFDRLDAQVVLPPDSGVQEWLRSVTAQHGIELLDPSDAMRDLHREQPGTPPLYLRADCHWSGRGHRFMADYLADWYVKRRP